MLNGFGHCALFLYFLYLSVFYGGISLWQIMAPRMVTLLCFFTLGVAVTKGKPYWYLHIVLNLSSFKRLVILKCMNIT